MQLMSGQFLRRLHGPFPCPLCLCPFPCLWVSGNSFGWGNSAELSSSTAVLLMSTPKSHCPGHGIAFFEVGVWRNSWKALPRWTQTVQPIVLCLLAGRSLFSKLILTPTCWEYSRGSHWHFVKCGFFTTCFSLSSAHRLLTQPRTCEIL